MLRCEAEGLLHLGTKAMVTQALVLTSDGKGVLMQSHIQYNGQSPEGPFPGL